MMKVIGIDHVGVSSDFDGSGGVDGWRNDSEMLNVTLELMRRGYAEELVAKILGGNLMRVLEQVARVAAASATMRWLDTAAHQLSMAVRSHARTRYATCP